MTKASDRLPSRRVFWIVAGASSTASADSTSTSSAGTVVVSTTTTATADTVESTGSDEASGDACDIVSDDVAVEVLGIEIVRREGHEDGQSVSCIKGTERNNDLTTGFYVSVADFIGGAVIFDQASAEEGSEQVAGLGDRAVFLPNAGVLYIADGADAVSVQVVKAGVPGSQQECVTVANDVLERRG